jgi:hypothetical protein
LVYPQYDDGHMSETPPAELAGERAEPLKSETPPRRRVPLRRRLRQILRSLVLIVAGGFTLFWLYTFHVIGAQASPRGDGMEWMAAFPMTLIFLLLTLPALIVGLFGRALIFGALVATASAFVNLWVWQEILAEFAG